MTDIDLTPIGILDDAAFLAWTMVPLRDLVVFAHHYPELHAQFLARWREGRR